MTDFIQKNALRFHDREFMIAAGTGERFTYADMYRLSTGFANYLFTKGVVKNDRVLVICDNSPEYVIVAFSLLLLGAVLVPVNPEAGIEEYAFYLENTDSKYILTNKAEKIGELKKICDPAKVIYVAKETLASGHATARAFPECEHAADDELVILHTSGTTKFPKGVILTIGSVLANFNEYGKRMGFNEHTRFMQVMPVYHADGWNFSILLPWLFGASIVLTAVFNAQICMRFEKLLNEYKATTLVAVPSILSMLNGMGYRFENPAESGLQSVICSSERLTHEVKEECERVFNCTVFDLYGLTETGVISYYSDAIQWKEHSVGKLQHGVSVSFGENDELMVRSPYLFSGYCNNRELSTAAMEDGWFKTGDTGTLDEEGYLHITGRLSDFINKSGKKINPHEVTEVIKSHVSVQDAFTIGVRDHTYGEDIYSFVALRKGHESLDAGALEEYGRKHLAYWKCPRKIIILDALPLNSIGKIDRLKLASLV